MRMRAQRRGGILVRGATCASGTIEAKGQRPNAGTTTQTDGKGAMHGSGRCQRQLPSTACLTRGAEPTCGPGDPLLARILAAGDALHPHILGPAACRRLLRRPSTLLLLCMLRMLRVVAERWGGAGPLVGRLPAEPASGDIEVFIF